MYINQIYGLQLNDNKLIEVYKTEIHTYIHYISLSLQFFSIFNLLILKITNLRVFKYNHFPKL